MAFPYKCSVSWGSLMDELRTNHTSIEELEALLNQGPAVLRHIQVDKVIVVNHLGQNIPVPTIFCSRWEVEFTMFSCLFTYTTYKPAR
jgi:hypothetical protein